MRFPDALNGGEPDSYGFGASLIETRPVGIRCSVNEAAFGEAIPRGYEIETREMTMLDDQHTLVKIHWLSTWLKKGGSSFNIDFYVLYIIHSRGIT